MNNKSLAALLQNRHDLSWEKREVNESGNFVNYMKIFSYEHHDFGLSDDGVWRGEYSSKSVTNSDNFVAFLSLLELERADVLALLRVALTRKGLPEPVIRTFPFDEILYIALKVSSHWRELAIKWLDSGYPISPEIAVEFPDLVHVVRWQKARKEQIIDA